MTIREGTLNDQSTIVSREVFEQYDFVIGIDFGSEAISCSVASSINQFDIHNIVCWCEDPRQKVFPIKVDHSERKSSFDHLFKNTAHKNIKSQILEILQKEYVSSKDDFYMSKLLLDVFKPFFVELKELLLRDYNSVLQEKYNEQQTLNQGQKLVENQLIQVKEDLKNCRFCVNTPYNNRRYERLLYNTFVDVGIIHESDDERLIFVTDAEAAGYSCLAWDRFNSGIKASNTYLVCNIGYTTCSFSKIIAYTTETKSKVYYMNEQLEGSGSMTTRYENELNKSVMDKDAIISLMRRFFLREDEDNRENNDDDSQRETLHKEYARMVLERLEGYYEVGDITKIFIVGRFASEQIFWDLADQSTIFKEKHHVLQLMTDDPPHATSRGAVTFGLRVSDSQLPSIKREDERQYIPDPPISPVDPNKYQYVVGIDFGTTFSGCSYALSTANVNDIKTIKKWKPHEREEDHKTPSIILFDKHKKQIIQKSWGFHAEDKKKKSDKNIAQLKNFKLMLFPQQVEAYIGEKNENLASLISSFNTITRMSPKTIISTYLQALNKEVINYLETHEKKFNKRHDKIKYVLTVPAMWNSVARYTMVKAAVDAGFSTNPKEIVVISEPEAAAIFCVDWMHKKEKFIVCDAGGGTVDLVTFNIEDQQSEDGETIKAFCQLGDGLGDTCGSIYIDDDFMEYMLQIYSQVPRFVDERVQTKFYTDQMDKFTDIKHKFTSKRSTDHIKIDFLKNVRSPTTTDEVQRDHLRIRREQLEEIFDKTIAKIINLLERQYEASGEDVKALILVGGLFRTDYVLMKVKLWANTRNIRVHCPVNDLQIAVSRGAVSYGLKPRLLSKKTAGQTYALEIASDSGPRFSYFVKKNDRIESEKNSYQKIIEVEYPSSLIVCIWSSEKENADECDFIKFMEKRIDMPQSWGKKKGDKILFGVRLRIGQKGVTIEIKCLDKQIDTPFIKSLINMSSVAYEVPYPAYEGPVHISHGINGSSSNIYQPRRH